MEIIRGPFLAQPLRNLVRSILPYIFSLHAFPFYYLAASSHSAPHKRITTKQTLTHPTPVWLAGPPAQRLHLRIDHPASSFFSLMDLWVSSKGRALLDAWCLGKKQTALTKAGWKNVGKKIKKIFPLGITPSDFQYLGWFSCFAMDRNEVETQSIQNKPPSFHQQLISITIYFYIFLYTFFILYTLSLYFILFI